MTPTSRSIDLHTHTTASDGDQSPEALVRLAASCGLSAIAVTDHDTFDGVYEAVDAGRRVGVEVVPGVELSAAAPRGQCHLLGLLIDTTNATIANRLKAVRDNRRRRNERMIERLQGLDIPITMEQVNAIAGGDIVARPHFAKALIALGAACSVQDAFDRYLAEGAAAHVPKDKIEPDEAIALIHGASGVAVLAHPNYLKLDEAATEAEIRRLQAIGLDGIEARYSQHTAQDTQRYLALAATLGMVTSGGSDFHGPTVKPHVRLGGIEDGQAAPCELLDALKTLAARRLAGTQQ